MVCLEPELEEAPEGEWYCPQCEKEGKKVQAEEPVNNKSALIEPDGIQHIEYCIVCKDGGELLCCEACPHSYHIDCLNPPLKQVPLVEWYCGRCTCEKPKAAVKKILTWRWKADPVAEPPEVEEKSESKEKKRPKLFKIKLFKKKASDEDEEKSKSDKEDEEEDEEENNDDNDDDDDTATTMMETDLLEHEGHAIVHVHPS